MAKIKTLLNVSSSLPMSCRKLSPFISHKSISSSPEKTQKDPKNSISNQANIVNNLLAHRNDPISALQYFNGVQEGPGMGESLCVLLQILVSSEHHHNAAENILNNHLSTAFAPNGIDLINTLGGCCERFGFGLNSSLFSYVLSAYVRAKRYDDAKECYYALASRGIKPSVPVLKLFLRSLIKAKMNNEVRGLSRDIMSKGVGCYDEWTVNLMMSASLREDKVEEAIRYFEEAKTSGIKLGTLVYSTAVRAACMKSDNKFVCAIMSEMQEKGLVPSEGTFTIAICSCVKQKDMKGALRLKDEMIGLKYCMNIIVATSLMKGYYQQGDLDSSLALFERIVKVGPAPNKVTYAVLIEGCCVNKKVMKARELYMRMKSEDIQPTLYIVNTLIRGYLQTNLVDRAMEQFDEAVESGVANEFTYNILISWFCEGGRTDDVKKVWDKMVMSGITPTDATFSAAINGLSKVGQTGFTKNYMNQFMALGFTPTCKTYNSIISGFVKRDDVNSALAIFGEMYKRGVLPDVITYTSLVNGLSKTRNIRLALKMLEEMQDKGISMDMTAYNTLIDVFCKRRDMKSACKHFDRMLQAGLSPTTAVYNTIISGFRDLPNIEAALHWKKRMENDGIPCDLATYTTLIDLFQKNGNVLLASELYQEMLAKGVTPDVITYGVLVRGLCSNGQVENAKKLLKEMDKKNITPSAFIYNTIITGYFREGNLIEAFKYQTEMLDRGLVSDDSKDDIRVNRNLTNFG